MSRRQLTADSDTVLVAQVHNKQNPPCVQLPPSMLTDSRQPNSQTNCRQAFSFLGHAVAWTTGMQASVILPACKQICRQHAVVHLPRGVFRRPVSTASSKSRPAWKADVPPPPAFPKALLAHVVA
ncbi:unnamed protein product [Polarella glacialis]|uniref:Uncharacterized protein n=1 Tax=Polarella glacialis TaxID=89957 RepID=A0A813GZS7_POLGL|nr:unnamed protein product [Polarella glacialis]